MPSLNFFKQFAPQVASGSKRQSIRLRQFQVGDKLYLFTGLRTTACLRLGQGVVTRSRPVVISYLDYVPSITVDGAPLTDKEMEAFARADGFSDLDAFIDFFSNTYDLPLQAWVTEWDPVAQTERAAA